MPDFRNNIHIDLVITDINPSNKKQLYQDIADRAADMCNLPAQDLYGRFIDKEKQASSGVGDGVAIPHMKFRRLKEPCIILVRLSAPVDFAAFDDRPVDLVCAILSPESEGPLHLQRLSRISRLLRHKMLRRRLNETTNAQEVNAVITASNSWKSAA